jgi:predicted nucleotidyltransferase
MGLFGLKIRELRLKVKLPIRTVAAVLDMDNAILSKIERGLRNAGRHHVIKLEEFFGTKENELLSLWLSDKIFDEIKDEESSIEALSIVSDNLEIYKSAKVQTISLIKNIKRILKIDGRVKSAWIYGSFARKTNNNNSDLDLIVEFIDNERFSMFDLIDIAFILESETNIKIDLVEKGSIKNFAYKNAKKEMRKIYDRD